MLYEGLREESGHKVNDAKYSFIRDECFTDLRHFRDDLETAFLYYCHPGPATISEVIPSLSLQHRDTLLKWAAFKGSQMLLIDGCYDQSGSTMSNWTTDLVLEIMSSAQYSMRQSNMESSVALVAHFCHPRRDAKAGREEIVVQDFLRQLFETKRRHFEDYNEYGTSGLTKATLRDIANKPERLWALFAHSVLEAGIRTLIIALENVDAMYRHSQPAIGSQSHNSNTNCLQKLVPNMQKHLQVLQDRNVTVKTIVTSRDSRAASYFLGLQPITIELRKPPER